MKIVSQPGYSPYKNKPLDGAPGTAVRGFSPGVVRTDRNSIAHGNTTVSDRSFLLLKSSVQDYVFAPAGRDRLDTLREAVQNGTYYIPADDLVGSIMSDDIFT